MEGRPGQEVRSLRDLLMEAASLADAGMPQSLIVRPLRGVPDSESDSDDDDKTP